MIHKKEVLLFGKRLGSDLSVHKVVMPKNLKAFDGPSGI